MSIIPFADSLLGTFPILDGKHEFSLSATGVLEVLTGILLCRALKLGMTRALNGTVFGSRVVAPFVFEKEPGATGGVARGVLVE